jgi:hypothetical protein
VGLGTLFVVQLYAFNTSYFILERITKSRHINSLKLSTELVNNRGVGYCLVGYDAL